MNNFQSIFLLMMTLIALVGCTPPSNSYNHDPSIRSSIEQIRTTDPKVIQQRWGSYADIVEKVWVYENQGITYWRDFQWVVPGAVISEYYVTCDNGTCSKGERLIQYNIADRRIERFTDKGELKDIGKIYNNGKVIFVFSGYPYPAESIQFDPVNKKLITDIWTFSETTREKFATETGFSHAETKIFQTNLHMQDSRQNNKLSINLPQKVSNNLSISQPKVVDKKRQNETSLPSKNTTQTPSLIKGTYQAEGGNYCVKVVQENNTLHLIEPNKESLYKKQSDGIYHFYNQKNDTTYGLRIVNDHTLDAFKPFVNGNQSTRLVFISDLSICASTAQAEVSKNQTWKDDDSDFGSMFTAIMLGAQKGFSEAAEQRRIEDDNQARLLRQIDKKNQAIIKQSDADVQPSKMEKNNNFNLALPKNNVDTKSQNQAKKAMNNANSSLQGSKNTSSSQSFFQSKTTNNSSKNQEQPTKLHATLEAIIACTKPDPLTGKFRCATPISKGIDGGPNSLREWSTPEAMTKNLKATCPNPRRLESSTHIVWGCGFGATNNSAEMDRSAGVDVKGRNTYYCYPKETGCRRITP